jgi:hypothetical protein
MIADRAALLPRGRPAAGGKTATMTATDGHH